MPHDRSPAQVLPSPHHGHDNADSCGYEQWHKDRRRPAWDRVTCTPDDDMSWQWGGGESPPAPAAHNRAASIRRRVSEMCALPRGVAPVQSAKKKLQSLTGPLASSSPFGLSQRRLSSTDEPPEDHGASSSFSLASLSGRSVLGVPVTRGSKSRDLLVLLTETLAQHSFDDDSAAQAAAPLTQDDFAPRKLMMDIQGVGHTCKIYAPEVFRRLRGHFNVSDASFKASLCSWDGMRELSTQDTGSKSGQRFFVSRDGRYFIKTASKPEADRFLQMLEGYYEHMQTNPGSLLCRFFGLLKVSKPSSMYFLIMANVLDTDRIIDERYDIKGSMLGRAATAEQKAKPLCIFKDFDFLARSKKIQIGAKRRAGLLNQIAADSEFLQANGMMDYSLLLGIHKRNPPPSPPPQSTERCALSANCLASPKHVHPPKLAHTPCLPPPQGSSDFCSTASAATTVCGGGSPRPPPPFDDSPQPSPCRVRVLESVPSCPPCGDVEAASLALLHAAEELLLQNERDQGAWVADEEIYYLGIIDFLQRYDHRKRVETTFKGVIHNKETISCVDPQRYARRFLTFLATLIE